MTPLLAHQGTSPADWAFVVVPLAIFAAAVFGLLRRGDAVEQRSPLFRLAARISSSLERLTGLPGWAVATVALGIFALLVAVVGFYWDVAWHIDLGRDKNLFTPPHTMIVIGLGLIAASAVVEVLMASLARVETGLRWGSVRIPWSALPLGVLGVGALMGFPLDDVWHRFYGVDVTMWGPTHLIMIGGASLTPLVLWLVLAEAGVRPSQGFAARAAHGLVAGAALTGLSTFQGEFDFGVPQFQLLYQPVLIAAAAGIGLVAARTVLGRWGALRAMAGFVAIRTGLALIVGPVLGLTIPHFPLYLAAAVAVELAAMLVGTPRRARFALVAGTGVATLGLAGEWAWMEAFGRHPWPSSMMPTAFVVAGLAAVAGAGLGVAFGAVASGSKVRFRPAAMALAGVVLGITMAIPFPRTDGDVRATMTLDRRGTEAVVHLRLDPPNAAEGARWFEAMSWQGGSLVYAPMQRQSDGSFVSARALPVTGNWKTLVRLHRGSEVMAVPVYFRADPEIGAPAIPAQDRAAPFVRDTQYLMRETHGGNALVARVIVMLLGLIVLAWLSMLVLASVLVGREQPASRLLHLPARQPRARAAG